MLVCLVMQRIVLYDVVFYCLVCHNDVMCGMR